MTYKETPMEGLPGWSTREYREGHCALFIDCDENGSMNYSFRHDSPSGPEAVVSPVSERPGYLYVCVTFQKVSAEVDKLDRVCQQIEEVKHFFNDLEAAGVFKIEKKNEIGKEGNTMKYEVTFARFGTAVIEADSRDEAMDIANKMTSGEVAWDDNIDPTDIQEA